MLKKNAKIVSLVPSWTETFIDAGLNVVGRTRFCVHPHEKVKNIPLLGGTKTVHVPALLELKPDFVVLDKEENKKELADELKAHGVSLVVSHVDSVKEAGETLKRFSELFESSSLLEWSNDYLNLANSTFSIQKFKNLCILDKNSEFETSNVEYLIWKDPYMAIGEGTFICDVLRLFKIEVSHREKYPKISEDSFRTKYNLFSSEPYPFDREFKLFKDMGIKGALVDGEKISWYGIRNLNFLKSCRE